MSEGKIQKGVAALVLHPEDKTKGLSLYHRWRNCVSIPSGTIDGNDQPEETLRREMKEELDIDIKSYYLLDSIQHQGQGVTYRTWLYVVDEYEGDVQNMEPHAHDNLKFVGVDSAPFHKPTNEVDEIFRDWLLKQNTSLESFVPEAPEDGWYKIPGHSYHKCKRDGTLMNTNTGYTTNGNYDDKGYLRTSIWDNDKKKKLDVKVHTLICKAFHGLPDDDQEVDHINGIRDDNRASNLKWVTRAENMAKVNSMESITFKW